MTFLIQSADLDSATGLGGDASQFNNAVKILV